MAGRPWRDPWPTDLLLGTNGVMLAQPKEGGKLVGTRPQTLDQVAPPEFWDDAQNPLFARPQIYADMTLGMGRKLQLQPKDRGYFWALNADLTMSHKWLKGPNITTLTPASVDSANGTQDFFEIGGVLYQLNGRYVNQRASDSSFTNARDFGAGKAGRTARLFTSAFAGAKLIFIAMGSTTPDKDWYYDGASWTQMANFQSLDYLAVGHDFYRASGINLVSKCSSDADPTNEANYVAANQFHVGDQSSPIVRLGQSATGVLLIFKTDGMYSLDANGQDIRYYPFLQFNKDPNGDSCSNIGYYENDVYVQWNGGFYRVKADFTLEHCGPELEVTNDSPVRGYVTASMGYQALSLYAGLWNPDTRQSYLMKFGAWQTGHVGLSGNTIEESLGHRIDAWHGSISDTFNSKITTLWQSAIGAPAGHSRCWIGFANGTVAYFNLPCTPDPSACTQYGFNTNPGRVWLPWFDATWLGDPKSLRKFAVECPNLSSSNTVQLLYQPDNNGIVGGTNALAALYTNAQLAAFTNDELAIGNEAYTVLSPSFTHAPRQVVNFPKNTSGSQVAMEVVLGSTSTASCPQVTGVVNYHAVRPELLLEYDYTVLALDGLVDRTGHPLRAQADEIAGWVRDACQTTGSVTTVLPDEVSKEISYKDYSESVSWDDRTRQYGKAIGVKGYEFVTNLVYGTNDRCAAYTNDQLALYTNGQLQNI